MPLPATLSDSAKRRAVSATPDRPSSSSRLRAYHTQQDTQPCCTYRSLTAYTHNNKRVKVIWQKAPHGGPIPRLGVTPGGRNLYRWIPEVGVPISVP